MIQSIKTEKQLNELKKRPKEKKNEIEDEIKDEIEDEDSTDDILVKFIEQVYESRLLTWDIINRSDKIFYIKYFMDIIRNIVFNKIQKALDLHESLKVNIKLFTTYDTDVRGYYETKEFNFKTLNKIILKSYEFNKYYDKYIQKLITEFEDNTTKEGSTWKLKRVNYLQLRINKYNPMCASSYIDLPEKLKK